MGIRTLSRAGFRAGKGVQRQSSWAAQGEGRQGSEGPTHLGPGHADQHLGLLYALESKHLEVSRNSIYILKLKLLKL